MKRYSRILAFCLALIMALGSLAACGKKAEEDTTTAASETTAKAETTQAEESTEAEESTDEAETTEAPTEAPTTEAATEAATEEADKKPTTKEEIIALYNDSINRVKTESKMIVSNYTLNTQTADAEISNKMLQGIANKLISANMGYDKKKQGVQFVTPSQILSAFPVAGQQWSSRLTAADVTKATCEEKDGVYTVTLYLVPDTTPNIKAGEGHAGKAFSVITKESIVEGAGSLGMSVIDGDTIKLTFKDARITAKIDKETGNVTGANYYLDWTLALTALGIDVAVSFGAEDDYTVVW